MDIKKLRSGFASFIKQNKYVIFILLAGLVLMAWPSGKTSTKENISQNTPEPVLELSTAQQLEQILTQVDGAGKVKVFLTEASGSKTIYQTDADTTVNADSSTSQIKTITITNAQNDELGLVQQINPPAYLGAIIVCQGADNLQVQLAIVDAVANVTGLGADRISVMKMK